MTEHERKELLRLEAARKAVSHAVADAQPLRDVDEIHFESELPTFACSLVSLRDAIREARAGSGRMLHVQFQP
jgi:hypothetical protein